MNNLNSLLPVSPLPIGGQEVNAIDGRKLHSFLEIGMDYTNWAKNQFKRANLSEGIDYVIYANFSGNPKRGRPAKDYMISVEAAKHICMMSGTEQGRVARLYFIECEKVAQRVAMPVAQASGPMDIVGQIGQALTMLAANAQKHDAKILDLELSHKTLAEKMEAIEADQQAAIQTLGTLPPASTDVPELTGRARVNMVVRAWVMKHGGKGDAYKAAWNKLFEQFKYRHKTDLITRAKHAGCQSLDIAEEMGIIEDLYALALHMFGAAA